jgi:hypothetical protein
MPLVRATMGDSIRRQRLREKKVAVNLLDEEPTAREFCEQVLGELDEHLLFPEERFAHTFIGIFATTAIDKHGDRLAPTALFGAADVLARGTMWCGAEHDPTVPPTGRVIAARSFFAPTSGEFFIAGVVGFFGKDSYRTFESVMPRAVPEVLLDLGPLLDGVDPETLGGEIAVIGFNPRELPEELANELLADSPTCVSKIPEHWTRKSTDPLTILSISVAFAVLLKPVVAKALEVYGEEFGKKSLEFLQWIKVKVPRLLARCESARVIFELRSELGGVPVLFLVDFKDQAVLEEAAGQVGDAAGRAAQVILALRDQEPRKLAFLYDPQRRRWELLYAATEKMGIVTDRPVLIAAEKAAAMGFSFGAIVQKSRRERRE